MIGATVTAGRQAAPPSQSGDADALLSPSRPRRLSGERRASSGTPAPDPEVFDAQFSFLSQMEDRIDEEDSNVPSEQITAPLKKRLSQSSFGGAPPPPLLSERRGSPAASQPPASRRASQQAVMAAGGPPPPPPPSLRSSTHDPSLKPPPPPSLRTRSGSVHRPVGSIGSGLRRSPPPHATNAVAASAAAAWQAHPLTARFWTGTHQRERGSRATGR